MKPEYWKYRSACQVVHKFSMDIIQRRRAALKDKKVVTHCHRMCVGKNGEGRKWGRVGKHGGRVGEAWKWVSMEVECFIVPMRIDSRKGW